MFRCTSLSLLLLLIAIAAPAAHGNWAWMRGAAVTEFTNADWAILQAEATRVLEEVESGVRVDWRNDETGNSGAIKALMTFEHEGQTCRRVAFLNLSRRGVRSVSNFNLCRQRDGTWGFVSDSEVQQ